LLVEFVAKPCEDVALVAGDDFFPGVEEAELDEVVIEERGAAREAHDGLAFDDARNFKAASFEQLADAGDRGAMLDVIAQPLRCLSVIAHDLSEDVVELAHVTLQVRRQRKRGAGLRNAAAFTLGHFSMAFPTLPTFFLGLALIVLGTGMLKPNVSTMVGFLYKPDDARRDAGFSLFYMGINLGAMTAPIVCGFLGQKLNWHYGFAAAGFGMLIGVTQYVLGRKHLPESTPTREQAVDDAANEPLTKSDWRRIGAICVLFLFALIFWSVFEQAGSTLTLFADHHTRLSILGWTFPSSWFQSEQPLFVIALAPIFAWFWIRLGKREPSSATKFTVGLALTAIGFLILIPAARIAETQHVRVSPIWLTLLYFVHTLGELCLSPVGLSLVTKISPKKVVGLMMGFWFLAASLGNFFAGLIASFADRYPLYRIFTIDFLLPAVGAIALAMLIRPLRSLSAKPT
jgi:POT family proton-dependent oligopeptide transporter